MPDWFVHSKTKVGIYSWNDIQNSKSMGRIIAAIDIGSMWMGFAYSLKDDWKRVLSSYRGSEELMPYKVPTCILLQKDFSTSWIGYEAEDKYAELISKDNHHDYFFFKRFQTILHQNSVSLQWFLSERVYVKCTDFFSLIINNELTIINNLQDLNQCYDIESQTLEAGLVFEHCFKCLKEHLTRTLERNSIGYQNDDIGYILTVPLICGEKGKTFMRNAAIKVKIILVCTFTMFWCFHCTWISTLSNWIWSTFASVFCCYPCFILSCAKL